MLMPSGLCILAVKKVEAETPRELSTVIIKGPYPGNWHVLFQLCFIFMSV